MAIIRLDENSVIETVEAKPEEKAIVETQPTAVQAQPQTSVQVIFDKPVEEKKVNKVDDVVHDLFSAAVVSTVKNDESVRNKITDTAKQVITNKTEAIKHDSEKEHTASFFGANESACAIFGYDDQTTPKWQVRMMKFGAAVWFVIYYILALFTVAPVMVFMNGLTKIIKKHWASMLLAILFYLIIIVGIPLISTLASGVIGK